MTQKDVITQIVIRAASSGDESVDRIFKRAQKTAAYLAAQGLLDPDPATQAPPDSPEPGVGAL